MAIPSVCSARPAMSDLLDGCVEFVEADDVTSWVTAIIRLENTEYRRQLVTRITQRAGHYRAEPCASAGVDLCNKFLR